jgi:hypothetical protein
MSTRPMRGPGPMNAVFEFVLFEHEPLAAALAVAGGIRSFLVDCEWRGKVERQARADTEIAPVAIEKVANVARLPGTHVTCRINAFGPWTHQEVEDAIAAGAVRIFLPMVEHPSVIEAFLKRVDGRAEAAIMIETDAAVHAIDALARLPVDAVYMGLNDLAISRGARSIFAAIADGTVERVRAAYPGVRFGFAGITVADAGDPVPCPMLLQEMARLACSIGFLRRSFHRDIRGRVLTDEIGRLHACWCRLRDRSSAETARDHAVLQRHLRGVMRA